MTLTPHKSGEGWIFCSDGAIKEGNHFICDGIIYIAIKAGGRYIEANDSKSRSGITSFDKSVCKKIVAQYNLNLPGIPFLEIEGSKSVDIKRLAKDSNPYTIDKCQPVYNEGFIDGYKAAQGDNKWTDKDLEKVYMQGYMDRADGKDHRNEKFADYLQLFLPPSIENIKSIEVYEWHYLNPIFKKNK
jgi:hypothetical protein